VGAALNVTATKGASQPYVRLANDDVGAFGNVPITDTVSDPALSHVGMSGGGGFDCGIDAGCVADSDCSPPNTCQSQATDGGTLPDGGILMGHCLP
jgi:hypothetical protein